MKKLILAAAASLTLAGCVSQDQADEKMARGCRAGVESLLGNAKIDTITSTNFSLETDIEGQHRRVTLNARTKDGWVELDQSFSCLFAQQWGFFKSSHAAILMQVQMPDGRVVGKKDGMLVGDIGDFTKLTESVNAAMNY